MLISIFIRVKNFLFSTIYKKQITCVGADVGQTLGSVFIDLTPINSPPQHNWEYPWPLKLSSLYQLSQQLNKRLHKVIHPIH